jgi:hypothetical protein
MKRTIVAGLAAAALVPAHAPVAQASTTRIPITMTSSALAGFVPGAEKVAGNSCHATGNVLVWSQARDDPMLDGTVTVDVSWVFGGNGSAWWGTELYEPAAYPGEGFTCSVSGHWDRDTGVRTGSDRCQGFGEHPAGWRIRTDIVEDTASSFLFKPGDRD